MNTQFNRWAVSLLLCSATVWAGDGDPTPRRTADPADDAKVRQLLAQRWRDFGADSATVTRTINQGPGGAKGCITNVGPAQAPAPRPGEPGGRYGPQPKAAVVVVTGSVINVCR